ncbi:MAG: glycosyltransferase family 4 protein [Vicinamibacterales bacterium]
MLRTSEARFVFFAQDVFHGLSRRIMEASPRVNQVLLSLGVESLDVAIAEQIRASRSLTHRPSARSAYRLGGQVLSEITQRRWLQAALTLSPFEVEVERWLGTRAALWVPRTIMDRPLPFSTVDGRVGCVSTLNHPPNLDGLDRLCQALVVGRSEQLRLRIVGTPDSDGQALARRFPFVEYLGWLDDKSLRSEASTWCCFAHPLFVKAKGCSTKLGVALGWGLPIATTVHGARGYVWDAGRLPLASTPDELADFVRERSRADRFATFQQQTQVIVNQTPTLASVAEHMRAFLLNPVIPAGKAGSRPMRAFDPVVANQE